MCHITTTLARNQFSALQQRLFPIYFELNALVSSVLLLGWIYNHNLAIAHITHPTVPDVAQAYALALVSVSQALNFFWFGPATSKYVMWQLHFVTPPHSPHRLLVARLKLEKTEGKDAHEANVSPLSIAVVRTSLTRGHRYRQT